MPSSALNNPYAEAYLQMNPAVARSYYLEQSGRSNYTLTSEHQKIVCVLIMIALGCYVVGFAIIMIRQVIRDTQHREADACDCVKYNGEHCERCPGSSDYLDEITDEVLKEIRLPALSARKQQQQQAIEISVNMDGTYCREYPKHDKLAGKECSDQRVACDKFSSNKYVNEEFLLDDCPFGEHSLLRESRSFSENHPFSERRRCSEPLFSRDDYSNERRPEEHLDSNHSASKHAEQTSDKAANQQFSLIKSADQSERAFPPITWQLPCGVQCGLPCQNANCTGASGCAGTSGRSSGCALPNGHCILAGKLASPTSFTNGCAILNNHLSSCNSLNFVSSPANCNNAHCSAANGICLLSNRIHCSLPINSGLIDGLSNAPPNGLANKLANGLENGLENSTENGLKNSTENDLENNKENDAENNKENGLSNDRANDQPNGQQTTGLTGSLTSCSGLLNGPSNGLLTNGILTDSAAYRLLLNGLANSAMNRLASSMRDRPPDSPSNPNSTANGAVSSPSSSTLFQQSNASIERSASCIRPAVDLTDGRTNSSPMKEELNFKQTEIHTNAEERGRLFNKVKSLLVLDYPKQKQSIEHL